MDLSTGLRELLKVCLSQVGLFSSEVGIDPVEVVGKFNIFTFAENK